MAANKSKLYIFIILSKKKDGKGFMRLLGPHSRWRGVTIVVLAAVVLEVIAALQYYHTREMMERNLEKQVLMMLRTEAMRLDGNLMSCVRQSLNQLWHAQQHLDDPQYMKSLVANLVKDEGDKVTGAAVAFRPDYFPQEGRWFELYARQHGDTVSVEQIGSEQHDYFQTDFYRRCMGGDTVKWSTPYMDAEGAHDVVTTYALPLRDGQGQPMAVLAIDITTGWIADMLCEVRQNPSSFALVLSEELSAGSMAMRQVIAAPPDSLCSPQLAAQIARMICDPTVEKAKRAGGHVTCFRFENEQGREGHVYYARKKYEPHWLMVRVEYDDEAFGELDDMQRSIFWATLIGLMVLGLIVHLFARNGRRLEATLMEQHRAAGELQIANGIQQALLPVEDPQMEATTEVSTEGRLIPAKAVGGDLYNVFVREGRLFFCIGDVSGKGVPSALIMAVTQTLFYNIASQENNPAVIMERINATACRNNASNMFVTLFIGVLDLQSGRLDYCNAGHDRPLVNGQLLDVLPNMPVGLFDDFAYEAQQMTIAPGDTLFLYTDGLTEARNAQGELFGLQRVLQLAARCDGMEPKAMVDAVVAEVKHYAEHTEQSDDLTLLAIKYKHRPQPID